MITTAETASPRPVPGLRLFRIDLFMDDNHYRNRIPEASSWFKPFSELASKTRAPARCSGHWVPHKQEKQRKQRPAEATFDILTQPRMAGVRYTHFILVLYSYYTRHIFVLQSSLLLTSVLQSSYIRNHFLQSSYNRHTPYTRHIFVIIVILAL